MLQCSNAPWFLAGFVVVGSKSVGAYLLTFSFTDLKHQQPQQKTVGSDLESHNGEKGRTQEINGKQG